MRLRHTISTLQSVWRELFARQPDVAAFSRHNAAVFPQPADTPSKPRVVLMEFNEMNSAHIAYSYLANVLAEQHDARIVAHDPRPPGRWWTRARAALGQALNRGSWRVYRSFGTDAFVHIRVSPEVRARARAERDIVLRRIASKTDLENLTVEGVWIGDLIYDTYLMAEKKPTIELSSPSFQAWLLRSLETFFFWLQYFEANDVRAVNVSHCVYNTAMPMRIAVSRDIAAFQINATHAYKLTKEWIFGYGDYFDFPSKFATLPAATQRAGLAEAQARIARRFEGEVGLDMSYSTKSAYGQIKTNRLLQESNRPKVLIATHCFFDSPHSYGNNLFPDFLEWLEFLGEFSADVDFDWYIKTHPDYLPGTKEIIDDFIARYPKFKLLPADSSHNQIIAEGISAVLTVYGTIGFEYAAKGIRVINASNCNPHVAYDFNIHPKNLEEYRNAIRDIGATDFAIDVTKVYEYYYMKNIFNTEDFLFSSYAETIALVGGYDGQFTGAIYVQWLKQWNPARHASILAALRRFAQSDDFRLDYTHFEEQVEADRQGVDMHVGSGRA